MWHISLSKQSVALPVITKMTLPLHPKQKSISSRLWCSQYFSVLLRPGLSASLKTLEAFYLKCLRHILGVRWHQHISNSDILSFAGVGPLAEQIACRRTAAYGHIAQLADNNVQEIIAQYNISMKRKAVQLVVFIGDGECVSFHRIPCYRIRTILQCYLHQYTHYEICNEKNQQARCTGKNAEEGFAYIHIYCITAYVSRTYNIIQMKRDSQWDMLISMSRSWNVTRGWRPSVDISTEGHIYTRMSHMTIMFHMFCHITN